MRDGDVGVTVIKTITQLRYVCPRCGAKIIMDAYPSDVAALYDGTLTGECPTCGSEHGLYPEREVG